MLVKTCAALLLGWWVYALLLPIIAIGFGGEALALVRLALVRLALVRLALSSNERAKASRGLPDCEIAELETGQRIPGGDRLWDAAIVVGD